METKTVDNTNLYKITETTEITETTNTTDTTTTTANTNTASGHAKRPRHATGPLTRNTAGPLTYDATGPPIWDAIGLADGKPTGNARLTGKSNDWQPGNLATMRDQTVCDHSGTMEAAKRDQGGTTETRAKRNSATNAALANELPNVAETTTRTPNARTQP